MPTLLREQCDRARGQMIALAQSDQVVLYTTNAQGRAPADGRRRARAGAAAARRVGTGQLQELRQRACSGYFFSTMAWLISTLALAFSVLT